MADIINELQQLEKKQLENEYETIIKEIDTSFNNFITKSQSFLKKTNQKYLFFNLSLWFIDKYDERLEKYLVNFLCKKYKVKITFIPPNETICRRLTDFYNCHNDFFGDQYKVLNRYFMQPLVIGSRRVQPYYNEILDEKLYLVNELVGYNVYVDVVKKYQEHLKDLKIAEEEYNSRTWCEYLFGPSVKFPELVSVIPTEEINRCNTYIYEVTW